MTGLAVINDKLFDILGTEIMPGPDGICQIDSKRFVFSKLFEHVKKIGNGSVINIKSRRKFIRNRKVKKENPVKKNYYKPRTKRLIEEMNEHRRQRIIARNKNGVLIGEFKSHTEAAKILGINRGNIGSVIRGERKSAGGYIFEKIEKE